MTFSPYTSIIKRNNNHSGIRSHSIDRITPHCFVGQVTAERGLDVFYNSTGTTDPRSPNYVIGFDGKIGGAVPEEYRSWCSSSRANDQRAITIEVASGTRDPYEFTEYAFESLVILTVDICKRYGKDKLIWIPDKNTALAYEPKSNEMLVTVHRWFAPKSCPGNWLMNRMDSYVEIVNLSLGNKPTGGTCMVEVRVCKVGDNNDSVKSLQSILKAKGYKGQNNKVLTLDGKFGENTKYAVGKFQSDNGMTADYIVGTKTWTKLLN